MSSERDPAVGAGVDEFYDALRDDDPVELYERAPCAYLSALPDGTVVKVNETFVSWTGLAREAIVGHRRLHDLLPAGGRIFWETHLAPMLRMQGSVREIATEVVCADGSRLPVILNAVMHQDGEGRPQIMRVALFDATERLSYERELVESRRRAEASEQRARALAETLQATLLPPELLEIKGIDVAGVYRPAGDGYEVGGDFYDVFETGRGTWGVVLGDVSGKGAVAASVTALARYAVRAEALRTPYPSAVLAALHDAISRQATDRFCTALFLVLDRQGDTFRITVSSGGHHLPIRLRDGRLDLLGREGSLLGVLDEVHLVDTTVVLNPGDVVVLYTDGVTEARRNVRFFGDEGLERVILAGAHLDARGLATSIVDEVVDFQAGSPRDDIAVVVLRLPA